MRRFPALILALAVCQAAISTPQAAAAGREQIEAMVVAQARDLGISIPLALAVAHAESNFSPGAVSSKGARGVMQIMPATAVGEYGINPDALWDAELNIRLGLHFLGRLLDRYRGRTDLALSYYNGGSRVGAPGNGRVIPATRAYVEKVRGLERDYRRQLWGI